MKERPIIFSAEMVRAILEGRKTQTRRTLKMPHGLWETSSSGKLVPIPAKCPYGQPGDRLWVRETFCNSPDGVIYRATEEEHGSLEPDDCNIWKPSINMPRWASRIDLGIASVKIERLQDISRGDCMAEGCPFSNMDDGISPKEWFLYVWTSINGPDSWAENPWLWVIEFKVIRPNRTEG